MKGWRLLGVCVLGAGLLAGGAGAALNPLLRFFRVTHSYEARFSQTVYDQDHQELQSGGGKMWIERPDKFRWDYDAPYRQQIVGDGHSVYVYDEGLKQVTVRPMARALGDTPALILSGRGAVTDHFVVHALPSADGVTWIDLVPRKSGGGFSDIRLGFRGTLLTRLILKDSLGQTTDIQLMDAKENRPIPARRFHFVTPAGVDVVHE